MVASQLGDKPPGRQSTGRHISVNWATMPPPNLIWCILYFVHVFIIVNYRAGLALSLEACDGIDYMITM